MHIPCWDLNHPGKVGGHGLRKTTCDPNSLAHIPTFLGLDYRDDALQQKENFSQKVEN